MGKRQESNRSCAKKYSLREGEGLIRGGPGHGLIVNVLVEAFTHNSSNRLISTFLNSDFFLWRGHES